jgi:peptidoglycan/xylan/chitin deacetylase (PgdA/CDA1 family)
MKIIASWDDACFHDLRLAELMKKYNIPTTFYWPYNLEKCVNVGRVKKFLTMEQCVDLSKEFEIGSHTVTHHYLTKINLKQARNEIFESKKLWEDKLGKEVTKFCYPRGYSNSFIKILVKNAGYKEARSTKIGCLTVSEDPFETKTTVHVGVDRVEYKNRSWEIFAREMIKEATEDSIYHIMGHSWEIEEFSDWNNFEDLLKELTGK